MLLDSTRKMSREKSVSDISAVMAQPEKVTKRQAQISPEDAAEQKFVLLLLQKVIDCPRLPLIANGLRRLIGCPLVPLLGS